MRKSYFPLFRVDIRHRYYAARGGVCKDLQLEPAPECRTLLRRFDLRMHEDADGYIVAYGKEEGRPAPVLDLLRGAPEPLTFLLRLVNPYFFHFTDLPFRAPETQKFYFHTLPAPAAGRPLRERNEAKLLTRSEQQDEVSGADHLAAPLRPSAFRFPADLPPPAVAGGLPVVIRDELGRDLFSASPLTIRWQGDAQSGAWEPCHVDLGDFPPGLYRLSIGEGEPQVFFREPAGLLPGDFGVLNVFPGQDEDYLAATGAGEGETLFPLSDAFRCRPQRYRLDFRNRATFWRYSLYLRPGAGDQQAPAFDFTQLERAGQVYPIIPETPVAEGDASPPFFRQSRPVMRPGNEVLLHLTSGQPIDLEETPAGAAYFTLMQNGSPELEGAAGGVRLPLPDVRRLRAEPEGPPGSDGGAYRFFSDMHVYL